MSQTGSIGASSGNRRAWSSVIEHRTIVVKGSATALAARVHQPAPGDAPPELQPMRGRIQFLNSVPAPDTQAERPGWDPRTRWPEDVARERARRYWPLAVDRVAGWLENPESCPVHLLLAVDGDDGTTVRYAWLIEPDGSWEYYTDDTRWGVPLGAPDTAHPALGLVLTEERDGREQQILQGYAAGIRVLDPT